ncbi:CHRD domain-containing protein [Pseudalkalibacillus sp. SCS-8]|uniref:CHRD domain-containing protein n=1 Tax=Pseudalkalibacillus nanhaiensis TaxID=3115291 RepID=UPI0032DB4BB6
MYKFFVADLTGGQEVPPVRTNANGMAKFVADDYGNCIKFEMTVNDIRDFVQAHIHFGERGVNGPVLAFLFGADLATLAEQNGISTRRGVVTGKITDDDIVPNNVGVRNVQDLLRLMSKKKTYVNVHTEQNPAGEIRGQIKPVLL